MKNGTRVEAIAELRAAGLLSPLDVHLALTLGRIGAERRPSVLLAVALLSHRAREGEVCVNLKQMALSGTTVDVWPEPEAWREELAQSALVGDGQAATPLVLEGERLYLRRYWQQEHLLAEAIGRRVRQPDRFSEADTAWLRQRLDDLFVGADERPDWQRVAAAVALAQPFCVISGGPGTGKTTTVIKLLALQVELALRRGQRPPRLTLAAPTGKAAARMGEAIKVAKQALPSPAPVQAAIPDSAQTIHRCLGARFGGPGFRHHAGNPLLTDLLLVDEASMVDLSLMAHLVAALPDSARLVLLGDRDQLAAVEAGAVLGEVCAAADPGGRSFSRFQAEWLGQLVDGFTMEPAAGEQPGIWDCVVQLRHSYRYGADSGLGILGRAINDGDAEGALAVLRDPGFPDVVRSDPDEQDLASWLAESVLTGFGPYLAAGEPLAALRALAAFRVLCVLRRGPRGVASVNRLVEGVLAQAGALEPQGALYHKRPVLVTRNDYPLRLFNGDVGCLLPDPDGAGRLAAFFIAGDSVDQARAVSPARLPEHETVFAMTVHKSQGSELDHILFVLPDHLSPVLTRELLYTAVSRARCGIAIYGAADIFARAVAQRTERPSGLREKLI